MRYLIAVMVLSATPVAATWGGLDFVTREGCMSQLSDEIRTARVWSRMPEFWERRLNEAPPVDTARASEIVQIVTDISRLHQELTNELMALCTAYPS